MSMIFIKNSLATRNVTANTSQV